MNSRHAEATEPDLTRGELFGWLARMYRRHQDEQDREREEPECDASKASE